MEHFFSAWKMASDLLIGKRPRSALLHAEEARSDLRKGWAGFYLDKRLL
jgi:hypothetical protein